MKRTLILVLALAAVLLPITSVTVSADLEETITELENMITELEGKLNPNDENGNLVHLTDYDLNGLRNMIKPLETAVADLRRDINLEPKIGDLLDRITHILGDVPADSSIYALLSNLTTELKELNQKLGEGTAPQDDRNTLLQVILIVALLALLASIGGIVHVHFKLGAVKSAIAGAAMAAAVTKAPPESADTKQIQVIVQLGDAISRLMELIHLKPHSEPAASATPPEPVVEPTAEEKFGHFYNELLTKNIGDYLALEYTLKERGTEIYWLTKDGSSGSYKSADDKKNSVVLIALHCSDRYFVVPTPTTAFFGGSGDWPRNYDDWFDPRGGSPQSFELLRPAVATKDAHGNFVRESYGRLGERAR